MRALKRAKQLKLVKCQRNLEQVKLATGRECGSCDICCTVIAVPELNKPKYEQCRHVCSAGCGIYEERPKDCRSWKCAWLSGMFLEEERPDKIKVIAYPTTRAPKTMVAVSTDGEPLGEGKFPRMEGLLAGLLQHYGWNIVLCGAQGEDFKLFCAPGREGSKLSGVPDLAAGR